MMNNIISTPTGTLYHSATDKFCDSVIAMHNAELDITTYESPFHATKGKDEADAICARIDTRLKKQHLKRCINLACKNSVIGVR